MYNHFNVWIQKIGLINVALCKTEQDLCMFTAEPGNSLGIGLGERSPSSQQLQGIFVQCIIEGTPAANDGRLRWNLHFDKSIYWKSCWVKIYSH